jgi:hypothetical protein
MGQAIVYCAVCNAQLREPDFARGAAFKIEHKVYCKKCAPADAAARPAERPASPRRHGITTTSGLKAVQPDPPRTSPAAAWIAGLATGILVVLIGVVFFSGHSSPPPDPSPAPPRAEPPAPPAVSSAETAARDALARLLRHVVENPNDLDRQQALLEEFAHRAPGTSVAPEVDREFARLARRRKERRDAELAELTQQVQSSPEDQAAILIRAARNRYPDRSWTEAVDRLLPGMQVRSAPAEPPPAVPVPVPVPNPAPAPARSAAAAPAPPAPPPAFPPGWESAMAAATVRDYAAALASLEKSPDLPLVKAVAALQRDSLQALAKLPRGQRVALGAVEGAFVRENGGIVELKTDAGPVEVETGEIAASVLIGLARSAGPVDPKTAAAFCLLEGDAAAARSLAGADASALPERFWAYADKVSRRPSDLGRDAYQLAVASLAKPATAAEGAARLLVLVRDHADDPFVRRNRAAIATRIQAGRDFVFAAEDLRASGLFKPGRAGKLESCWTVEADVEPAKQKDTFVDVEFSTLADTPYRAWVWVGGCCQEVFDFSCQGSEMEAGRATKEPAEPGAGVAIPIKPYVPSVKKTHAQHNGPKQPARWEWVPLPLPRYAKPGPQRIRILSDQKGFSVAAVLVSATRTNPPSDAEIRESLRGRGERPKLAEAQPKTVALITCAFDGTDQRLVGDLRERALHGVPMFGQCFTGVERNQPIVLPEQGELRLAYFLKSPSDLFARIRVEKDGATLPYDVQIQSPVVGTPTEVRIPLSAFHQAYVNNGPRLVPGDSTRMIYVFGLAAECGLRIDAFSLVEFRK